mmetsp:Transcript_127034/g.219088  ORF Transcript_127034/g.219088 Transcript_127034/m.219088 type:complete len:248 (-) Transcript_127034:76-819(-)
MEVSGGADPAFPAPLDCPRQRAPPFCHNAECEKRHLDEVEQTRWDPDTRFRYPSKPSLVIAASPDMGRTASTWVFNALRLLYRQAGEACDSYWIRSLSRDKLEKRLATGANVLVKTHENPSREIERLAPMFSHVVVSVRQGFSEDPNWAKVATYRTQFEQIVAGGDATLGVLREMADHLGIVGLSDSDLRAVDYELMTMPIPGHQTFKTWSFHSRRGGRPQPTAPPSAEPQPTATPSAEQSAEPECK